MHITFGPLFFIKERYSQVKIQNGGHFERWWKFASYFFGFLAHLWIFLRDFHDINTVSYNGKEQIVSKAKSGTHVHVHVKSRSLALSV